MENVAVKLNSGFTMRPFSLFQSGGTRSEIAVAGQLYGMTRGENVCRYGYATLCEKLNKSKSTVARSIKWVVAGGLFSRDRRGGKTSEYTYAGEALVAAHVRTENFFYTEEVFVFGKKRRLNDGEVDVLSLISTATRGKTERFEGSTKTIAGFLGLSERSVRRAIKALLSAKLIFRPKKGVNNNSKNVFAANMKWIRAMEDKHKRAEHKAARAEMQAKKAQNPSIKATVDADARSGFDKYYSDLRQAAYFKWQKNLEKISGNVRFLELSKALGSFEFKLAKAELRAPATLPALQIEQKKLKMERDLLLQQYGLTEAMLSEEYYFACKRCKDTGHLPNGTQCDCWKLRT